MRILGIDTATPATAVALCDFPAEPLEARDDPAAGERPGHASRLLPLVAEVLDRSGARWEDVDRIAVGVGPGGFTGMRIGVATARALAHARGIPLVAVSTLRSLASNVRSLPQGRGTGAVLAVLDARRGEVFAAAWQRKAINGPAASSSMPLLSPGAHSPEALIDLLGDLGEDSVAIGDGAVKFRSVLERSGAFIPRDDSELHRVTAINHCRLAPDLPASGLVAIRPEYLRLPDAESARAP